MEAIREYLSNLFMNMPETPDVLRAKAELMEMMEDKYEELIKEGKTEKEAIGIVISEFGNLEELAKELGIDSYMKAADDSNRNAKNNQNTEFHGMTWQQTDMISFIRYSWSHAWYVAIGVLLCIVAPFFASILEGAQDAGYISELVENVLDPCIVLGMVAVAVVLFCLASSMRKRAGKLKKKSIMITKEADLYLRDRKEKDENRRLILRVIGIFLCIVSVIPSSANYAGNPLLKEILDSSVLLIVGIAVLMLVLSASVGNRYKELQKAVIGVTDETTGSNCGSEAFSVPGKKMPLAFLIGFIVLAIAIIAGGVVLSVRFAFKQYNESTTVVKDGTVFSADEVNEIRTDLDVCNVTFKLSDEDEIRVGYEGDESAIPEISDENGVLRIVDGRNWHVNILGFFQKGMKREVTVFIPKEKTDLVYQLTLDVGNMNVENITGKSLSLEVDAGNIDGTNVAFEKAVVEVDAGNVTLAGNISDLSSEIDAGNFEFDAKESLEMYSLNLHTELGNVHVDNKKQGNDYEVTGSAQYRVQAKVDAGNITIK